MTDETHQPEAPERKSSARASACILTAAALWGVIGLWNRNLMAAGMTAFSIVPVRNIGALLVLTVFFAITDRSVFHVKKEHLKYFFGTGIVSMVLFTLCYFSCQQICSLAVASILLYTAPSIVVILSAFIWKTRVTRRKAAALVLTFLGCACVTGVFSGGLTVTAAGILLGLGSGFFYALYTVFGRFALDHYGPMTVTYWTYVFGAAGALFLIRPAELAAGLSQPRVWWLSACMIVLSSVLPYIFYTKGLSRVEPGKASIMASIEPVVASLVGVLAFGESLTAMTLAGVLLILAGVYILK